MNNTNNTPPKISTLSRVLCLILSGLFIWAFTKAFNPKYFQMWEFWAVLILGILCIGMFLYTAISGRGPGGLSKDLEEYRRKKN